MSFVFDAPLVLLLLIVIVIGFWVIVRYGRGLARADRLALCARGGALVLLCVALAGPRWAHGASERFVYFLIDRSASVGLSSSELLHIAQSLAQPRENTSYGVISFGAQPLIEATFAPTLQLPEFQTEPDRTATDIASAVRLALETFPRTGRREIVLVTDGQSDGDLPEVLGRARREGVPIHVWPLSGDFPEVWLYDLQIPTEATLGVPFSLRVHIGATDEGTGTLVLYRNGALIQNIPVEYKAGIQELRVTDKLDTPGEYAYRVYLKAEPDRLNENNQLYGVTAIPGGPQVLLVESAQGESVVARLIRSAGFPLEQKTVAEFSALPLSRYKAIILNNIPLGGLTQEHRRALKNFVSDLGGGLFVIQGREAVAGLENQTAEELADLEELLPISYLAPEPYQIPGLALVFVMDRSGSMGDPAGSGVSKIEILKRAALRSIEVLDPDDWVGLIAFDTEFDWIVPLKPLGDKQEFNSSIQRLNANGGTDLYFALKSALETLEKTPARVKHILVFTDGHNNNKREREYHELYERFQKSTVRVSTLGIDRAPNEEFLLGLANAGRGRYQRVQEFTDLPVFSLREVRRIARLRWIEGHYPVQTTDVALAPPPVRGYVLTHERLGAQTVLLTAPEENPLLAFKRYGLGQVGVLNTDLAGEGAPDWLVWEGLGKLVADSLARIYRQTPQEVALSLRVELGDETVEMVADMRQGERWVSGLVLRATLAGPTNREVFFSQEAPGRYRARLEQLPEGLYMLRLEAQRDGKTVTDATKLLALPYAQEYRRIGLNSETASEIVRVTGGQFLERPVLPQPSGKIRQDAYRALWPWALLLALGLFITDLALRKLWALTPALRAPLSRREL
ncbi:MAG: VWA domain-containing protein [Candidatus Bipolaricaulia bacterium]